MKKLVFLIMASILFAGSGFSQKADFRTAEKFKSSNLSKMLGSSSVRPVWLKDIDEFWYSYKTGQGKNYWLVDPGKKVKEPLFDNHYIASEVNQQINKILNHLDLPLQNLKFKDDNKALNFEVDSFKFEYELKTKKLFITDTIDKKEEEKKKEKDSWKGYNKDSTWIVFARQYNLFIMKADDPDSIEYQLTTDGEKYYSWGGRYRDSVEEDTTKRQRASVRWFEDNTKFYVTRSDSRKVKDLWVINVLKNPRPELETYRYAMPGDENVPQSELWVFNAEDKSSLKIDTDKWKDQTFRVQLLGDNTDELIITRKDRTCAKIEICKANAYTGEVSVLYEETDEPYFNGEYSGLSILNEGKDYIWWSERTGFGQLYLYDADFTLVNPITRGNYVVGNINRIDTAGRVVYFEAFNKEPGIDPYYKMFYRVNFDGSGLSLLTPEDATHSMSMAKSNKYFVDSYSRVDMPPVSVLRDNKGNILLALEEMDLTRILETGWQMPEKFIVKAVDGVTDLYGVIWKPFKMEEGRKYPIISYVYPGPQTESVPRGFSASGKNQALAQLGFVVVSVGHRGGSPQRYKYYHTYGYDNLRDYTLADDKYAMEQLADRFDFIDITKVGIFGHSGGGFMSTAALFTYPDFYTAAVSSSGNHDNNIYNLWWGETHHGVTEVKKTVKKGKDKKDGEGDNDKVDKNDNKGWPEEDSVKKEEEVKITFKSVIPKNQDLAKNLKGHLLLVHGDIDNNVHPGNSIRVADALIAAGKRFDFMVMPGQRHGYGKYSEYFEKMMWYYFAEHLLGDYRTNVEINNPDK